MKLYLLILFAMLAACEPKKNKADQVTTEDDNLAELGSSDNEGRKEPVEPKPAETKPKQPDDDQPEQPQDVQPDDMLPEDPQPEQPDELIPEQPDAVQPEKPKPDALVRLAETQFWIFEREPENQSLFFNLPWITKSEQDANILRDPSLLPAHVQDCAQQSAKYFESTFADKMVRERVKRLVEAGATKKFIIQLNVLPEVLPGDPLELRKMDRHNYFWHWNGGVSRPDLSLSLFKKGMWVWEVISTPDRCLQPSQKELRRYLEYAEKRLIPSPKK